METSSICLVRGHPKSTRDLFEIEPTDKDKQIEDHEGIREMLILLDLRSHTC